MDARQIVVVGGGAAGFFAAITCADAAPDAQVIVLEKGPRPLAKVRISGGGRCNVTHACFEPREFAANYPRGGKALIGAFQRFQAADTVAWFEARGVNLKREADGRMFPATDCAQTIVDCLLNASRGAGVRLVLNQGVTLVRRQPPGFLLTLSNNETLPCHRLLLATGGCRTPAGGQLAVALGHTLEPPVPSLFSFHIQSPWLRGLAGIAVEPVEISVPNTRLRERGPMLITHAGVSGPAVLRLSAWGARFLHDLGYQFPLHVNWLPRLSPEEIAEELSARRQSGAARLMINTPIAPLPARLWEQLTLTAGIEPQTRWAALSRGAHHALEIQLRRTILPVTGKSLNKEEFVTCGGVPLSEVNFATMESRLCPGLHLAGELLDIDGLTGGFNFQGAWTTGWIAGRAMADSL